MATLTHAAFRSVVEKFGSCDEYYSEMINAGTFVTGGPFEKYYIIPDPVPEKMVWQITGRKTEHIVRAAEMIAALPGRGIDINMGCSAPEIMKSGAGAAWLTRDKAETREMISSVHNVLHHAVHSAAPASGGGLKRHKRLSVKLRLGDEHFTDNTLFALCDMLVEEGVEQFALHARTSKEKYRTPPRWEYVEKLCARYSGQHVSIVLNGNVRDVASLNAALKAAPHIDGIMIARAAVERPWVFATLRASLQMADALQTLAALHKENALHAASTPQMRNAAHIERQPAPPNERGQQSLIVDREQTALDFIDFLERYQPQAFWKTRLQRFFAYYCAQFLFAHYFTTRMLNAKNLDDARKQVRNYFVKQPSEKLLALM